MRPSIVAILCSFALCTGYMTPLRAQTPLDNFEVNFQARETQRRAIIVKAMQFSEIESKAFWPRYDSYRSQAKHFQQRRLSMLSDFSASRIGMTDGMAVRIITSALKLEDEQQRAKQQFVSSLHPLLTNARYFRYYQLETKLDAMFTYGWTKQIPLAITEEEAAILEQMLLEQKEGQEGADLSDI